MIIVCVVGRAVAYYLFAAPCKFKRSSYQAIYFYRFHPNFTDGMGIGEGGGLEYHSFDRFKVKKIRLFENQSPRRSRLWALFHKTLKTSLHRLTRLRDVFMFYETEPWAF